MLVELGLGLGSVAYTVLSTSATIVTKLAWRSSWYLLSKTWTAVDYVVVHAIESQIQHRLEDAIEHNTSSPNHTETDKETEQNTDKETELNHSNQNKENETI